MYKPKPIIMRQLLSFLFIVLFSTSIVFAQQTDKELTKELNEKAVKLARKEAKQLEKDGWYVSPGSLPLEKQLDNSYKKQYMTDENGDPRYITADGNGVGQTKTAAELQAIEMAKLQLAGSIQTRVSSLVSANIGNSQLNTEDAASVTEIVQSAKNIIATELGYINPFVKMYREGKNKTVEVQVKVFYDVKQSMVVAKKVVQKEIKDKLEVNEEQLNSLMGL
jgi:hypothetical protein